MRENAEPVVWEPSDPELVAEAAGSEAEASDEGGGAGDRPGGGEDDEEREAGGDVELLRSSERVHRRRPEPGTF